MAAIDRELLTVFPPHPCICLASIWNYRSYSLGQYFSTDYSILRLAYLWTSFCPFHYWTRNYPADTPCCVLWFILRIRIPCIMGLYFTRNHLMRYFNNSFTKTFHYFRPSLPFRTPFLNNRRFNMRSTYSTHIQSLIRLCLSKSSRIFLAVRVKLDFLFTTDGKLIGWEYWFMSLLEYLYNISHHPHLGHHSSVKINSEQNIQWFRNVSKLLYIFSAFI